MTKKRIPHIFLFGHRRRARCAYFFLMTEKPSSFLIIFPLSSIEKQEFGHCVAQWMFPSTLCFMSMKLLQKREASLASTPMLYQWQPLQMTIQAGELLLSIQILLPIFRKVGGARKILTKKIFPP